MTHRTKSTSARFHYQLIYNTLTLIIRVFFVASSGLVRGFFDCCSTHIRPNRSRRTVEQRSKQLRRSIEEGTTGHRSFWILDFRFCCFATFFCPQMKQIWPFGLLLCNGFGVHEFYEFHELCPLRVCCFATFLCPQMTQMFTDEKVLRAGVQPLGGQGVRAGGCFKTFFVTELSELNELLPLRAVALQLFLCPQRTQMFTDE